MDEGISVVEIATEEWISRTMKRLGQLSNGVHSDEIVSHHKGYYHLHVLYISCILLMYYVYTTINK